MAQIQEHVGSICWARPKTGTLAPAGPEHHDIRWCAEEELDTLEAPMDDAVKWYCRKAIEEIKAPRPAYAPVSVV